MAQNQDDADVPLEELLRLARGGDAPPQKFAPAYLHLALVRKWANFYGFQPGSKAAGKASDIYTHFSAFVREELGQNLSGPMGGRLREGLSVAPTFGQALKRMGFRRSMVRSWLDGTPQREIMMNVASADLLRDWIRKNGHKRGANPWNPRGRV